MALKFLNKKGWHTGSLRNIENVWKAEQKHEAEQKKLEELRKQIQEERDRTEFRLLQEQAGLVPKQERLDFLYDSGLAVGKNSGTGAGFKALESAPKTDTEAASSSSTKQQQSAVPGALFEEKPQSANDAWRKLHSDPLLMIRQREQEALARVRNNPIQMAMIRKSVEGKKHRESTPDGKEHRKKHHHKKSKHRKHSSKDHSDEYSERGEHRNINDHKVSKYDEPLHKSTYPPKDHSDEDSEHGEHRKINDHKGSKYDEPSHKSTHRSEELRERDMRKNKFSDNDLKYKERPQSASADQTTAKDDHHSTKRYNYDSLAEKHYSRGHNKSDYAREKREDRKSYNAIPGELSDVGSSRELHLKRRNPVKLSEEERAARLREMQMDAELHEEQRWKRLRKAEENDAQEAIRESMSGGKNFLDATQRSIYGAEKGGSSTIEESVRRRKHYLQDRSES